MFKTSNRNLRNSAAYEKCQRKLLKEEIKIKEERQKSITKELKKKEEELSKIILYIDFIYLSNIFGQYARPIQMCRHYKMRIGK